MFYSKKHNLLFIASPKSGTVSVQNVLRSIDPNGEERIITLPDRVITSKDMKYGVMGHARAYEIEAVLGKEAFSLFNTIGFVRHPLEKLISSYYFGKKIRLSNAFTTKGEKRKLIRTARSFISSLMPKILPLEIYVVIYPMKTSFEYFHDRNGERIVKYLGRTDHLSDDLLLILNYLGINYDGKIPHSNKTQHRTWREHVRWKPIRSYLVKKYQRDIELYREIERSMKGLEERESDNS